MRTYFDCIPCFMRQVLDSMRRITNDEALQESVIRDVLRAAEAMDFRRSPPAMGQIIHRIIRAATGSDDPYREDRERSDRMALDLYPGVRRRVLGDADPFAAAVRVSGAGNAIDLGAKSGIDEAQVADSLEESLNARLDGTIVERLRRAAAAAGRVLVIGDNAGEIVFDRLLVEQLGAGKVVYAVRGGPVINDATATDARMSGMTDIAEVIDSGSDAPGTILDDCSRAFRERFLSADVVLAKGQGNYETLSDADRSVFFLLRVKCGVVAGHVGREVGSLVLAERK